MFNARVQRILQRLMNTLADTPEAIDYLGARSDAEYMVDDGVVWQAGDDKPEFVKEGLKGWREL